jgi:hypothetical protein
LHSPNHLSPIHRRDDSSNARAAWPVTAATAQGSSTSQAATHTSTAAAEQQPFALDARNIIALSVAFMVKTIFLHSAIKHALKAASGAQRCAAALVSGRDSCSDAQHALKL